MEPAPVGFAGLDLGANAASTSEAHVPLRVTRFPRKVGNYVVSRASRVLSHLKSRLERALEKARSEAVGDEILVVFPNGVPHILPKPRSGSGPVEVDDRERR